MQPMSGTTRTYNFDVNSLLWNVILIWESPCGDWEPKREIEQCNHAPVTWERARQWVNGVLTGIGKDWQRSKYQDIYIQPATRPRPWDEVTWAAFLNELRRDAEMTSNQRRLAELDEAVVWPPTPETREYMLKKKGEIYQQMEWNDREVRACSV